MRKLISAFTLLEVFLVFLFISSLILATTNYFKRSQAYLLMDKEINFIVRLTESSFHWLNDNGPTNDFSLQRLVDEEYILNTEANDAFHCKVDLSWGSPDDQVQLKMKFANCELNQNIYEHLKLTLEGRGYCLEEQNLNKTKNFQIEYPCESEK